MNKPEIVAVVCLTFAAGALGAPGAPPDDPPAGPGWTKETLQWFVDVEEGSALRVTNPFGNVYARFGGYEPRVELLATVQRIDRDLPPLEVRRDDSGPGLVVTVARQAAGAAGDAGNAGGAGAAEGDASRDPRGRDRIDLVVFVPLGVAFDVTTRDGDVQAKGVRSDVTVTSETGDIRLRSIRGHVQATSDRGDIAVSLENATTDKPQRLATVTGDIEVYLWEDAAYDVRAATSGEISTDFSMDIEHRRFEEPGKHATALVGGGGPRLELWSRRGRVKLLRSPKNFTPDEGDLR